MSAKKNVNMNLPISLIDAIKYISQIEKRNFTKEVEFILEGYVKDYLARDGLTIDDIMTASESSLKKIWGTKEEDEAWDHL